MSITRYAADGQPHHDDRGPWVLYAEHLVAVEALRQAEQGRLAVSPWAQQNWDEGYLAGQRDALAGAVARVLALPTVYFQNLSMVAAAQQKALVIAAIKGDADGT